MKRRKFLKTTAITGIASALYPKNLFSANERLQIGIIGTGLRGQWNITVSYTHLTLPTIA